MKTIIIPSFNLSDDPVTVQIPEGGEVFAVEWKTVKGAYGAGCFLLYTIVDEDWKELPMEDRVFEALYVGKHFDDVERQFIGLCHICPLTYEVFERI